MRVPLRSGICKVRFVTGILIVVFVLLQFKLWLGEGGYRQVTRLEHRVATQRQKNDELVHRNERLQAEVEDLRERLEAVEERARNELGLIKPEEEFYQVVPPVEQNEGGKPAGGGE